MLSLIQVLSPEPVTLAEVKEHLGVDHNDDDALIGLSISAAREYVERYTGRALVEADYLWSYGPSTIRDFLPIWPATINRAYYIEPDGTQTDLDISDWNLAPGGMLYCQHDREVNVELHADPAYSIIPNQLKIVIFLLVESTYDADPKQQDTLRDAALRIMDLYKISLGF